MRHVLYTNFKQLRLQKKGNSAQRFRYASCDLGLSDDEGEEDETRPSGHSRTTIQNFFGVGSEDASRSTPFTDITKVHVI